MRALLSLLTVLLAGCGATEEEARHAVRDQAVMGCVASARQSAPASLAGYDWRGLCGCATDRLMAGRSAAELVRMEPGGPRQREAFARCARDLHPAGAIGAAPRTA
jgi:hypothetical protein